MAQMLTLERRRRIAEVLRLRGFVSVSEMAADLGISEITLRRDLRAMGDEGLLVRTHGGAVLPDGFSREPTYTEKANQAATEKAAIARLAVAMVRPGDSIVLGAGTTTLALAHLLVDLTDITVVTNSLLVVQALMGASQVEVILTGGTLRRAIHALVGPAAADALRALRATVAFISGNGLTAERGLSTPSPVVAEIDRALAASAQRIVVLADHTKIGQDTMCQTVPLHQISTLITDSLAHPQQIAAIREAGVNVLEAEVAAPNGSIR